jgi:hypothetical protein
VTTSDDPVLHIMLQDGVPITRQHYIHLAYFGDPPKPWTREHEAELPPENRIGNSSTSTTLADLLMLLLVANPFSAMRASPRR